MQVYDALLGIVGLSLIGTAVAISLIGFSGIAIVAVFGLPAVAVALFVIPPVEKGEPLTRTKDRSESLYRTPPATHSQTPSTPESSQSYHPSDG